MWVRGLKFKLVKLSCIRTGPSHPMWVRGLKYSRWHGHDHSRGVAPHVGAWIEIRKLYTSAETRRQSHPMWVRGLKLAEGRQYAAPLSSHPMWVRGLKYYS